MPTFSRDGVNLYYEIHGEGYPILLFAPGGMRSALAFWAGSPFNPIKVFSEQFQVIAMDQRNAGQSTAPISAEDSWHTYTNDHIALLDHLNIDQCHIMGGCIGGPYCFGLMQAQPQRVTGAIIQQTIGLDNNRDAFYAMFDSWAVNMDASDADLQSFRANMYDSDFLFNVDEQFVAQCSTPLLVLLGDDLYHPRSTSERIAELAPNATLIESWAGADVVGQTAATATAFLNSHRPTG
ncbi:MAG: alpha/beta hydrolase [Pseudomonadales bacterium]|nr:alpha/beta hydrolase [Pseudomonadales bacterium]